ncbi:hypothetical protein ERO13_A10G165000v2 [Gossypium hirsutum]|uniref:Uncharacterized protein isoform X3 n=1 Tax=Gossypium hirsutum TaxID=3635 RepID=A0ABM2YWY1_GOSHI|nr:uncharacterized protein LOC107896690 isoform X3 [Gossypium hirsutum]KAG4180426.1 hypothetical protein ERO13_A10G165000v2 [Gossypium hirsutum]
MLRYDQGAYLFLPSYVMRTHGAKQQGQKLIAVHMVQKITRQLEVTQAVVTFIRLPHRMGAIMQIILLSSVQTILKIQVGLMPLAMQVQILCIISSITSNGLIITINRKLVVPLE